jgi:Cof subfamily protein (haloacid dehalogenase superfamily)
VSAPRLLALDLDGTLLRTDFSVSERTRRSLARAQRAGARIVLVTARSPRSAREIAADLGLDGWAICASGATTYDLDSGRIADHRPLATGVAHALVAALRESVDGVVFGWESELTFGSEPAYELLRSPQWPRPPGSLPPADPLSFGGPFTKLIARSPRVALDRLHETTVGLSGGRATVTLAGEAFVELLDRGVTKGAALARLAARLGVAAEETAAFGDQLVDLSMLEWAGLGVAPANARPAVLRAADEVTASNDEDGVAAVLERLFA